MSEDALFRLAHAAGISTDWTDAFGMQQHVAVDTLRAILTALKLSCDSDTACEAGIAVLAEEEINFALPPLITAQADREIVFSPHAKLHGEPYRITFEQGGELVGYVSADSNWPACIAPVNRIGYHQLAVGDHQVTLAVAPLCCFSVADAVGSEEALPSAQIPAPTSPRLWVLAAQLYSLRRNGDSGIGDFTALKILAEAAAQHGAAGIAISPAHAMFSANPYHYSPYAPSSRLFFNVLHIDPAAVSGEEALNATIRRLHAEEERQRLRACELIDWPAAARWQLAILRELFEHYDRDGDGWREFNAFRRDGGATLEDHARFEALHAMMRRNGVEGDWRSWPPQYRNPYSDSVAIFAAANADDISFHAFLQWQAARSLQHAQQSARAAGMKIGLISDLAVGADGGGSQAWSRQREMLHGLSVGAPPDVLGPRGQSWGLSAFSPRALRQQGYQAYIEMLRAAFRYAGGVRIDHIFGLARMWLVPEGAHGTQGAYLRYPFDDLIRLIALESHRYRAIVIGEDLGTAPPGFGEALADAGLMGIRVLWFQRDDNGFCAADRWPTQAIATTTTHDLPTTLGWWQARDIAWREKLDLMAPETDVENEYATRASERQALSQTLNAMHPGSTIAGNDIAVPVTEILQFVGSTPAPLAIIPLEDVLGLNEQPNLPNTTDSHPNWQRRLPEKVEDMLEREPAAGRLAALNRARSGVHSHKE